MALRKRLSRMRTLCTFFLLLLSHNCCGNYLLSNYSEPWYLETSGIPESDAPVSIVLWHGMGDNCCHSFSMGAIKKVSIDFDNSKAYTSSCGFASLFEFHNRRTQLLLPPTLNVAFRFFEPLIAG